jgi:site-specific DNA-methyltransferase (adenine-specific)
MDATHSAIALARKRLSDAFPASKFDLIGTPKDLDGARSLAARSKREFQKWALSMLDAQPFTGSRDADIGGYVYFRPDGKNIEKAIVSVEGGGASGAAMIEDLIDIVAQQGARMGVFVTLHAPTKGMIAQAASAGAYQTEFGDFPKIQIVEIEDLFKSAPPLKTPGQDASVFKQPEMGMA